MLPLPSFKPRLFSELKHYSLDKLRADLLAGTVVGIVAIPLAMAFAIASGATPEQGLITGIIAGFIISALGGTRLCIGGPTGAFVVILYGIMAKYGWANLLICTMMAGLILIAMGMARMGGLIRFVPNSVIIGFTNGIAVLIALSQVKDFLGLEIASMPGEFFGIIRTLSEHLSTLYWPSFILAISSLMLLFVWPPKYARYVPAPFVVLIIATLLTAPFDTGIASIGSRFGEIKAYLPTPQLPEINLEQLGALIPPAITIALLAAIESLLCAVVANKTTRDHADANQELIAQGIANVASPLFGGLAATSAIARTSTNIRNGARTPVAGIVHAAVLLAVLLVAAPLARFIPMPALAAILMWVAFNMGEWREFKTLRSYSFMRNTTLVATFALTVLFDLTVAVQVGMVLATLLLIKRLTETTRITTAHDLARDGELPMQLPDGCTELRLRGIYFFGIADKLERAFDALTPEATQKALLIDCSEIIYLDSTVLEILRMHLLRLKESGTQILLYNLDQQPASLIRRTGFETELGTGSIVSSRREAYQRCQAVQSDNV